ncbi:MAG TPA: hypothetical protein VG320_23650 [Paraburkholderia sp.]|jgi:hypothetical protein|uniref:hypothetical protein n=1 Tax=Paraburkholderia sp. TaxID=1926495 RepID=UPI002DEF8165|nr:hypothetical protein [Paraburkholderia sp.]
MKRLLHRLLIAGISACAVATLTTPAHAQVNAPGPFNTPAGTLQFVRDDHDFVAMLDRDIIDRFDAKTLTHFDETGGQGDNISRVLVQSAYGPVLYDLRRQPPVVQHMRSFMTVKRVFWQPDEVVMQGPEGWFRFKNGTLTKLTSSKMTYH